MEMLDQLTVIAPKVALVLALNVLGFYLKRSPIRNWVIPWTLIALGMIVWPIIAETKDDDYTAKWITHNVIIGVLLGAASIGLHQVVTQVFPFLFPKSKEDEPPKGDT